MTVELKEDPVRTATPGTDGEPCRDGGWHPKAQSYDWCWAHGNRLTICRGYVNPDAEAGDIRPVGGAPTTEPDALAAEFTDIIVAQRGEDSRDPDTTGGGA